MHFQNIIIHRLRYDTNLNDFVESDTIFDIFQTQMNSIRDKFELNVQLIKLLKLSTRSLSLVNKIKFFVRCCFMFHISCKL